MGHSKRSSVGRKMWAVPWCPERPSSGQPALSCSTGQTQPALSRSTGQTQLTSLHVLLQLFPSLLYLCRGECEDLLWGKGWDHVSAILFP